MNEPNSKTYSFSDDELLKMLLFDLRSPLYTIRGFAEMLKSEPIAAEKVFDGEITLSEVVERILTSSNRAIDYLHEMQTMCIKILHSSA